jgi:hypothetical protein
MTMPQIPEYIIKAFSASLNVTQRELNLMSAHPNNQREADMWAASFAARLNEQRFLNATDWQPQTELVNQQFHVRTQ